VTTTTRSEVPVRPTRTLCLGEALVDLICERQVDSLAEARTFTPHFGGVVANVAMVAARAGAEVGLAGCAGGDDWGWWLRDQLEADGIDLTLFALLPDHATRLALVTVDAGGEASYRVYGDPLPPVAPGQDEALATAVRDSAALFLSTNTMIDEADRALSMRARELALEHERPVIFDPNVRLHRWGSAADAAATANACVPRALLVRANLVEATLMTGEDDPERAARALLKAGARMVVLTFGAQGAMLRGEFRRDVAGVPAQVLSTVGAGDVLTGFLLAKLALSGFYPAAVAAALEEAVARASLACERWGALD
jgi:fructokinase